MTTAMFRHIARIGLAFIACAGTAEADPAIDRFAPTCAAVAPEMTSGLPRRAGCYDLYGAKALASVDAAPAGAGLPALRLGFHFVASLESDGWLSIRRPFPEPVDLSDRTGLSLALRVERPSDARLRVTLSDQAAGGGDDLWWLDLDADILARETGWIDLQLPFDGFRPCHGRGCRTNDRALDLSRVVAWEINVLETEGGRGQGVILLRNIHAN